MYNYNKSVISPYDPRKLAIHSISRPEDNLISNCGPNLIKTVSFDDVVHFIEEENMVTYVDFDCGITFYHENPTKFRQVNREQNYISRSCGKPDICVVDELHSSIISMNPYNLWDLVPAAPLSLCHTNDTYSFSISTLNQQLNNLEQTHIWWSLHYQRWTVKGRDCASVLHSFKEITYRTDEWTKQLLRLKSWVIFGSPEQWMELHFLWGTVIVSKCSYLFHLFDFYCLLV